MYKILILGVGGIGGYVASILYDLILHDQLKLDETEITVVDDDFVELKNIKYQNFDKTDITKEKAKVIGARYDFDYEIKRIKSDKDLEPYNVVLICVDNPKTRLLVYKHCIKNNKFFIDGRAEGKSVALFTKDNQSLKELEATLGSENNGGSCQLEYRLNQGIIDLGNRIVAPQMAQCLLNHVRNEENPKFISGTF